MATKKTTPRLGSAKDNAELQNFAHHLAEALRIARYSPMIPASLYNGLADALVDFENDLPSLSRVGFFRVVIIIARLPSLPAPPSVR